MLGRWSCQRQGVEENGNPEDFYEDRCCQDIFQNFLATITSRVNTITGTAYRCCLLHAPPHACLCHPQAGWLRLSAMHALAQGLEKQTLPGGTRTMLQKVPRALPDIALIAVAENARSVP